MRFLTILAAGLTVACTPAPMTPERAESLCAEQIGLSDGIEGAIHVGIGSSGSHAGASITLTRRIFAPQTEDEFMAECVERLLDEKPAPIQLEVSASSAG